MFCVFTECIRGARRQMLVTTVMQVRQEKHGKADNSRGNDIGCCFHRCNKIPNKKQLRGRKKSLFLARGMSEFKLPCGEDMTTLGFVVV